MRSARSRRTPCVTLAKCNADGAAPSIERGSLIGKKKSFDVGAGDARNPSIAQERARRCSKLIDEFEREHNVTIGDDAVALRHAVIDAFTQAMAGCRSQGRSCTWRRHCAG